MRAKCAVLDVRVCVYTLWMAFKHAHTDLLYTSCVFVRSVGKDYVNDRRKSL